MMLAADKRRDTHSLSNNEKENWMEDYVDREAAVALLWVTDSEITIQQEQEDMR